MSCQIGWMLRSDRSPPGCQPYAFIYPLAWGCSVHRTVLTFMTRPWWLTFGCSYDHWPGNCFKFENSGKRVQLSEPTAGSPPRPSIKAPEMNLIKACHHPLNLFPSFNSDRAARRARHAGLTGPVRRVAVPFRQGFLRPSDGTDLGHDGRPNDGRRRVTESDGPGLKLACYPANVTARAAPNLGNHLLIGVSRFSLLFPEPSLLLSRTCQPVPHSVPGSALDLTFFLCFSGLSPSSQFITAFFRG
jgi:hypothetical protein